MNFQTTGYTIKRVQQQIHVLMEDSLRPLSLTLSQYNVLKNLDTILNSTGAKLAKSAFVTPQTMHTMLIAMERKKLVVRTIIPGNSKSLSVSITSHGKTTLSEAESILGVLYNNANTVLSEQEHIELELLLTKLSRGLVNND